MTVTRGRNHTFVGVGIEFTTNGTVKLSMDNFVNECISIYNSDVKNKATTPAKGDLFEEDTGDQA